MPRRSKYNYSHDNDQRYYDQDNSGYYGDTQQDDGGYHGYSQQDGGGYHGYSQQAGGDYHGYSQQDDGGQDNGQNIGEEGALPEGTQESWTTIYLTIFIFRGVPDTYNRRHVVAQFQTENQEFNESIHIRRHDEHSPWEVDRVGQPANWANSITYINHVNAGTVQVPTGEETMPVEIFERVTVTGRENDWNCQSFLYEGLQGLVDQGLQTQEWYNEVESEVMDKLLEMASA